MDAIRFEAIVERLANRPIVRLPAEASAALPSRGQVAVIATMGTSQSETIIEPDGRRGHWMNVAAGASGNVAVLLEPMAQWPEPVVPADLTSALHNSADASRTWADITPMARHEWVRWIDSTRNADTRTKRVDVSIDKLRRGMRRPCCFDLSSCTDPELARGGKLPEAR